MEIAKILVFAVWISCAACAVFLLTLTIPTFPNLGLSDRSVCIPGWSIRCHESDCGTHFQRCGSKDLHEVPEQKVCYRGALLPITKTDLHSCPSIVNIGNTTLLPLGPVKTSCSCSSACNACASVANPCPCYCGIVDIKVKCSNGVVYNNCKCASCKGGTGCRTYTGWTQVFEGLMEFIKDLFTFQSPDVVFLKSSSMISDSDTASGCSSSASC